MMKQNETWAIVPAGGSGQRFSPQADKLQAKIAGLPVLIHTLKTLLNVNSSVNLPVITGLILAAPKERFDIYTQLIAHYIPNQQNRVQLVSGGPTRRDSVYNGLCRLPEEARWALIHDAARPLVTETIIQESIRIVTKGEQDRVVGVISGIPVHDTLKRTISSNNQPIHILETIDRAFLWKAQTPQIFLKTALLQAHQQVPKDCIVTDDAQLIELAELGKVALTEGSLKNLKITTQEDLQLAKALFDIRLS
jgi:2-C-methyl-D-erythritol 4-phosphate cytidylyltransferase